MEGLLIWIAIIAISSLLRNAGKKKKEQQRAESQTAPKNQNNDDKPNFRTNDRELLKKAFQDFDDIFEPKDIKKTKAFVENEKLNTMNLDENNTEKSFNEFNKSLKDNKNHFKNYDITENDIQLESINNNQTKKSVKNIEIKDIHVKRKSNINIKITKNTIVNGIVMSEILGKPKSRN